MSLILPKKISPDPLLSSTVEVRFTTDLSREETLARLRPKFIKEFPKLTERGISAQKNDRPELEYIAEYILIGEKYHLFLDNNVIAFENTNEYSLWDNYYPMIKGKLQILSDTITIKSIQRVALRYVSFFDTTEKLSKVLKFEFDIPVEGYKLEEELFRTQLCKDNIKLLLHLARNAEIKRNNLVEIGTIIDIDVSQSEQLPNLIGNELFDIINKLHSEEKIFFFSLLREEFLRKIII